MGRPEQSDSAPFGSVIVVDWSASSVPKRGKDSIWIGQHGMGATAPVNPATRDEAMDVLDDRITAARAQGHRVLVGADFPFGYPAGFAKAVTGVETASALWQWFARNVVDRDDNSNNRFALADRINETLGGTGPFWGRPHRLNLSSLPEKGTDRRNQPFAEKRMVEVLEPKAQSVWKLYTTGSVGSQAMLGIARLARLRHRFGSDCAVWPFEPTDAAGIVLAEVWPSLLAAEVRACEDAYAAKDAAQVDLLARSLAGLTATEMAGLLLPDADPAVIQEEGWILGAGQVEVLRQGLARKISDQADLARIR